MGWNSRYDGEGGRGEVCELRYFRFTYVPTFERT